MGRIESRVNGLIQVPDGRIAAKAFGRLGNQMFNAATALTYARRTGRRFVGLTKSKAKQDYPEYLLKTVLKKLNWLEDSELKDFYRLEHGPWLCNGFPNTDIKDIWLDDFFQDVRCIDKDIAYSLFSPSDEVLQRIHDMYGDLSDTVAVNVRRGDYLNIPQFNVLSKGEIEYMMKEFFPNSKFIFISDDIKWCMDNFSNNSNIRFSETSSGISTPEKAEMDLYTQTVCKANIISNSTFSWWGAYLNKNAEKVIVHSPWVKPGRIPEFKYIIPKEWIKVEYKQ